jgi:hypothetical protein
MTPSQSDARSQGAALRQARSVRVRGIRQRVLASALALFVATWLLITMMLVTGHDPALAVNAIKAAAVSSPTTTASGSSGPGSNATVTTGASGTASKATTTASTGNTAASMANTSSSTGSTQSSDTSSLTSSQS